MTKVIIVGLSGLNLYGAVRKAREVMNDDKKNYVNHRGNAGNIRDFSRGLLGDNHSIRDTNSNEDSNSNPNAPINRISNSDPNSSGE